MTDLSCAPLVEKSDPDRFAATMTAPVALRGALFTLYAFNLEVARAPWMSAEPMIARMRLQWWADVLSAAAEGAPAPAHEVAGPLTRLIQAKGVDVSGLQQLIDAREWDVERAPFADEDAFWTYLDQTGANLMVAAAEAIGAQAPEPSLRAQAQAGALARWFCAIPALQAQGRVPLVDGRPEAVRRLAREGLARLRAGREADLGAAVYALRSDWQAEALLRQAARKPERVGEGQLALPALRRSLLLSWRSLRGR